MAQFEDRLVPAPPRLLATLRLGALAPLCYTGVSIVCWLGIAALLTSTGALWTAVEPVLGNARQYSLQRQLFAAERDHYGYAVIGDGSFIHQFREHHEAAANGMLFLEIPAFHLNDLDDVLSGLKDRIGVDRLIIQSSPHFWSDFWSRVPGLKISLWKAYGGPPDFTLDTAEIVFETLRKAVSTAPADLKSYERPQHLLALNWDERPARAKRGLNQLDSATPNGLKDVFWLRDERGLNPDGNSKLLEQFRERFGSAGFRDGLGHVLPDFSALPDMGTP